MGRSVIVEKFIISPGALVEKGLEIEARVVVRPPSPHMCPSGSACAAAGPQCHSLPKPRPVALWTWCS